MFIDLHAHYPMHLGLPVCAGEDPISKAAKQALFDFANEVDNYEPINKPRVTPEKILASGATGVFSVLYDPEDEFLVAQEPHPIAIRHIQQQAKNVEEDALKKGLRVAKTLSQVDEYISTSQPFLVHCMEGGHGLSADPGNVKVLENMGVTYIILAHLRYMGLAGCAKGLPCKTDFWQNLINQEQDPRAGLSDLGLKMLEAVLGSRTILDVTHCSDLSRQDVRRFYESTGCHRPIISSHTGVRALANYELNVSDEWIRFIADSGGVVGVIFFPFWLSDAPEQRNGLSLVFETIDHIRAIGGDECVAIGTDLDGFIQPIDECRSYSEIPQFLAAIGHHYERSPQFRDKLLFHNALRVVHESLS